jgi:hypothetical protein
MSGQAVLAMKIADARDSPANFSIHRVTYNSCPPMHGRAYRFFAGLLHIRMFHNGPQSSIRLTRACFGSCLKLRMRPAAPDKLINMGHSRLSFSSNKELGTVVFATMASSFEMVEIEII